ncbi:MAG: hypothetical protein P9M00_01135 [Candidatus Tritonobacter lacicola]|nr:hypothetical protein [Candidatus Tritonobacter lacicola]
MSVAIGAIVYALTRSFAMALGVLVGGVLIDLDHFVEHFSYRGLSLDLRDMFHLCYYNLHSKLYLLLHSYELLVIIWIAALFVAKSDFLTGFAIGFTIHIIMDQIDNPARALSYFFIFRAIKKFDGDSIRRPGTKGKPSQHLAKVLKKSAIRNKPDGHQDSKTRR